MDHAEEGDGQLLKPHGHAAVALDALEEILHQAALLVDVAIELAGLFSAGSRWNDGVAVLGASPLGDRVGVVALVGDDVGVPNPRQQLLGLRYVVDLSFGEVEMNRISEGVDTSVNLRGWSSSGSPDSLRSGFF